MYLADLREGKQHAALVTSSARAAPLKKLMSPSLELLACLVCPAGGVCQCNTASSVGQTQWSHSAGYREIQLDGSNLFLSQ